MWLFPKVEDTNTILPYLSNSWIKLPDVFIPKKCSRNISKFCGNLTVPGLNTAFESISAGDINLLSIEAVMLLERTTYTMEPKIIRLVASSVVYQIVSCGRTGREVIRK